jgi:hypothetical protein
MKIIGMPAWMAGIQVPPRMSPETSMLIWIPAVHAGMRILELNRKLLRRMLSKEQLR